MSKENRSSLVVFLMSALMIAAAIVPAMIYNINMANAVPEVCSKEAQCVTIALSH